jgi:CheY-like chemotaxis protein
MPGFEGGEPKGRVVSKILIVDDEPNNRLLMATILEHAGYEIEEAADGAQALALARALRPDLIIVDLHMPGMGGVDLIKALRADSSTAAARVALYTATPSDGSMDQFLEAAGIDCVITKPSEPEDVLRVVKAALER